jgi:hypothetical protein
MKYLAYLSKIGWALDVDDNPDPPLPSSLTLEVEADDHEGALRAATDAASDQTGFLIDYARQRAHPEPTVDYALAYENRGVHATPGGAGGLLIERYYQAPGRLRRRVRFTTRPGVGRDAVLVGAAAHVWSFRSGWLEVATLERATTSSEVEQTLDELAYELLGVAEWVAEWGTRP